MRTCFGLVFREWGLPDGIRVDNGAPWGSAGDLPTAFCLWLSGLPVKTTWNPPRQPQYNGVVERSNRLVKEWAEPATCQTVAEFERRVALEDQVQREQYPALGGRSRLDAFPALSTPRRTYSPPWEKTHWNFELAKEVLSHYAVQRCVDSSGKIGVYGGKLYVGRKHQHKAVWLHFDPDRVEWVVSDPHDQQIYRAPANGIRPSSILKLEVGP